ncbi:hypothetical protein Bbelb_038380 [Branchiostoma belcheri]|nr:hypothetical protein Bbelb_038380 [Branchiostoma belcheri]
MSKHVLNLVHSHDTIPQTGALHIRQIRSTTVTNIDGSAASIIPLHPPRRNSHLPAMTHINSANSEHIAFSWLVCDSCNLTRNTLEALWWSSSLRDLYDVNQEALDWLEQWADKI